MPGSSEATGISEASGISEAPGISEAAVTLAGDLHARPAGSLAIAAAKFKSSIALSAGAHTADAKSVLSVMGIGATSGQVVTVRATGPDADAAVAAITEILAVATKVGG
jgi:phosphocarrier protein HPr